MPDGLRLGNVAGMHDYGKHKDEWKAWDRHPMADFGYYGDSESVG